MTAGSDGRPIAALRKKWKQPCKHVGAFASTLFAAVMIAALAKAAEPRKTAVISFGLSSDQDVFRSEAAGAARAVAKRFGGDPVIVRFNTNENGNATVEKLAATLDATGKKLDPNADLLFLILTSHGSPQGLAVTVGRRGTTLSPSQLGVLLDWTRVRYKVVIISACYSGVFIPRLASADTLVITAADATHPSFGCENGAKWTYFGDAFFNTGLRKNANLRDAFALARSLILKREQHNGFEPSNPQMAGGENVAPLLVPRRSPTK
jgi:Peptidase C13 family